jgi:hypothetical protein
MANIDGAGQQILTNAYTKFLAARSSMVNRLVQLGKGRFRSEVVIDAVITGVVEYVGRVVADPNRYADHLNDVPPGPTRVQVYVDLLTDDFILLFQQISFGSSTTSGGPPPPPIGRPPGRRR